MPTRSARNRRRLRRVIAAIWVGIAGLTTTLAILEWDERSEWANLIRLAIVVLMVVTAFLLVRHDADRPR
jgi:hypothetical protein